jgi:hypothetical protein
MNKPCPLLRLAEAVRDGRADSAERMAFERHLNVCSDCRQTVRELNHLAAQLRSLAEISLDAVSVRRLRRQLLTDMDAALLKSPMTRLHRKFAVLALVGMLATALMVSLALQRRRLASETPEPTRIAVQGEPGARWSEVKSSTENRIVILEGRLRIDIRRGLAPSRVAISLPDGEIEDFGTVLRVTVSHGQTQQISVERGVVMVRIRDCPEAKLGPGETWTKPAFAASPPRETCSVPAAVSISRPRPRHSPVIVQRAVGPRAHGEPAATRPTNPSSVTGVGTPSDDRRAAMLEDAAYLRVVDLLKADRVAEGKQAAFDYLLRFPNGFRRIEVLDIISGQGIPKASSEAP